MAESEQIEFTATAWPSDIIWSSVTLARSSRVAVAFGTFILISSIGMVATSTGIWIGLAFAVFGLSLVTGLFAVPFALLSVRQGPETQLAPTAVQASLDGVSFRPRGSSSSADWSTYRRAVETDRAYLLEPRVGPVLIVPKRGVGGSDLGRFRALLTENGLLAHVSKRRGVLRWMSGVALGAAAAVVIAAATVGLALLQANARIDLEVAVADGIATVVGSTDLPDGSLVQVDVCQADDWRRGTDDGRPSDIETFPWIRGQDVEVDGGRFVATIAIGGWPAGNGGAIAQFWVDAAQPDAVRDRFGTNGERLHGPHVDEFDDGTPRVRVHTSFEIP